MNRRTKILICDDEPFVVRLLQVHFERKDFEVLTASDGREALSHLESDEPDVCLLDVMMPYVSGLEVLAKIRATPSTENLPVIILSVKAQDDDVFEAYAQGADMHLTKPFDPEEIVRCVELILQHSQ